MYEVNCPPAVIMYKEGRIFICMICASGIQGRSHVEVVVVVAGDGEVPHPALVVLGGAAAVGDRDDAVTGLEAFALLEFGGLNPLLARRVPEEVVGGGVDVLGAVGGLDG